MAVMREALFRDAFEQIGLAAGKAAALPDHRERVRETPTVDVQSSRGEVSVSVHDGKLSGLRFDELWFQVQEADGAALLIQKTINEAYEKWAAQELEGLMEITPDVKELYGALGSARAKLDEAWVQALTENHS